MRGRSKELAPEVTQGFVNADTFFRRGSSGQWRDFIETPADATRYQARVAELADPDLAHWAHGGLLGSRSKRVPQVPIDREVRVDPFPLHDDQW
jgi:hypothetical protein